jgi:dTDP-4-dehydrorhamnose reductase
MKEKILIFGRKGWLAKRFNEFLKDSEISDVDITDSKAVRIELRKKEPDVVINTAGRTGRPNIDWCEEHKKETATSNIVGPLILAEACREQSIYWVHLGSGCIFQGNGSNGEGFKENDEPDPPSFYSWTKYWGDSVSKNSPVLILRLRMPVDNRPHSRNLIDKLAGYGYVIDSQNSITIIPDLLEVAKQLIEKRRLGIYHVVNPGTISPAEIMELYKKEVNPKRKKFMVISNEQLHGFTLVKARRSNCTLNTDKLQREGIKLKPIKERITELLREYKMNLGLGSF